MDQRAKAKEAINTLHEISQILNTNIDKHTLSLCVSLCERGVSPEALASIFNTLLSQQQHQHKN